MEVRVFCLDSKTHEKDSRGSGAAGQRVNFKEYKFTKKYFCLKRDYIFRLARASCSCTQSVFFLFWNGHELEARASGGANFEAFPDLQTKIS